MHGTSGMSLTCHKNSRAVERILPQTEKLKKTLIVKVVVSKNLYSCFDRLSDIVLYLT